MRTETLIISNTAPLASELHRANVVTMNSEVVYEDCATGVQRRVTVVLPKDADARRGQVSVLAPIGSALLGLRVGQTIEWQVPSGSKQIRVLEVRDQPERQR